MEGELMDDNTANVLQAFAMALMVVGVIWALAWGMTREEAGVAQLPPEPTHTYSYKSKPCDCDDDDDWDDAADPDAAFAQDELLARGTGQ
jgi:hypothetical protein